MRFGFLLYCCLLASVPVSAQEASRPAESFYVELMGNTRAYSLNVDVVFPRGMGFRLGALTAFEATFSDLEGYGREQRGFVFLMMAQWLHGGGPHRLETGLGIIAGRADPPAETPEARYPSWTATLGYRYQPVGRGLLVRAGFTPTWAGGAVRPMVGVSLGYCFEALFR